MIKTPLSTMIGGAFWTPEATVINGAKLSFEIVMKKLFSNGEQGFFYDPNDLSTMYQDAAGTVPVTAVGQPVGLMLDKSKELSYGSERITGGNFELGLIGTKSDGSGSASTWTLNTNNPISGTQDGNLIITTATTGAFPRLTFSSPAKVVGALCEITFNYKVNSGTAVISQLYNGSGTQVVNLSLTGNGIAKIKYIAVGTIANETLYFGNSLCNIQIDNFSCKQILGNHASQTQSAMRPLLVASPQRLDYDIADDKLITALPAQLTGCTVIRAVPNVGTQILTNQTIPATYNDNTDHCGLIVINRALTPSETSAIATEFNKRAGV